MTAPAATPTNPTDTPLLAVLRTMADHDFAGQFRAEADGVIRCLTCRETFAADGVSADELTRLEGASDPADMLAVVAVTCPHCRTGGSLVLSYGPLSTAEDVAVLSAFTRDPDRSSTDVPGSA